MSQCNERLCTGSQPHMWNNYVILQRQKKRHCSIFERIQMVGMAWWLCLLCKYLSRMVSQKDIVGPVVYVARQIWELQAHGAEEWVQNGPYVSLPLCAKHPCRLVAHHPLSYYGTLAVDQMCLPCNRIHQWRATFDLQEKRLRMRNIGMHQMFVCFRCVTK